MASYEELHGLFEGSSALKNKIKVAIIVAAEAIRNEDGGTANHANRLLWAAGAFESPGSVADKMLMAVLAANKAADVGAIAGASDITIQANVDAVVDMFATGG